LREPESESDFGAIKRPRAQTGFSAARDRTKAFDFDHFFLQPMDGPLREENTALAIAYCLDHPRWRVSLQTHKYMGIA
jgi:organic radical activating enzyme